MINDMPKYIPPYASEDDIKNSMQVVKIALKKSNIIITNEGLKKLTIKIMSISYAKGSGYSSDDINSYINTYIEEGLYKKCAQEESI
jgi:hypothetical protein